MKISVITAVHNRADTIADAVTSLQAQSYASFEHLVVDGGSTDGTLEVLARIEDPRMSVISEPDEGIYDAINKGLAAASGEVIGLMHADDVYASPQVLENVAGALANPDSEAVYGDLEYVSARDPDRIIRHWRASEFAPGKLRRGWMPPHPTLYVRRSVIDRWGGYDTSYRIAADYDAVLRWFGQGQVRAAYIPEVLVRMRMGGESNRSLGNIVRKSREDYRALKTNRVGGLGTLALKNLGKMRQFLVKRPCS